MNIRVEFTDGTQHIYKDCSGWEKNIHTNVYHIVREITKTTHESRLFSREVIQVETKTSITTASIESQYVILIEEAK